MKTIRRKFASDIMALQAVIEKQNIPLVKKIAPLARIGWMAFPHIPEKDVTVEEMIPVK